MAPNAISTSSRIGGVSPTSAGRAALTPTAIATPAASGLVHRQEELGHQNAILPADCPHSRQRARHEHNAHRRTRPVDADPAQRRNGSNDPNQTCPLEPEHDARPSRRIEVRGEDAGQRARDGKRQRTSAWPRRSTTSGRKTCRRPLEPRPPVRSTTGTRSSRPSLRRTPNAWTLLLINVGKRRGDDIRSSGSPTAFAGRVGEVVLVSCTRP